MCKIVALIKIEKTQLNKRGEAAIENSKYVCVLLYYSKSNWLHYQHSHGMRRPLSLMIVAVGLRGPTIKIVVKLFEL